MPHDNRVTERDTPSRPSSSKPKRSTVQRKPQQLPMCLYRQKSAPRPAPNPRGVVSTYVSLSGSDGYGAIPVAELDNVLDELHRVRELLAV